jgi:hypothetical protein
VLDVRRRAGHASPVVATRWVWLVGAGVAACGGQSRSVGVREDVAGSGGVGGLEGVGGVGAGLAGVGGVAGGIAVAGTGGDEVDSVRGCRDPMEAAPELADDVPPTCPNGSVGVTRACSEVSATGFDGVLDGEPIHLEPVVEAATAGTVSVNRRACGGPLTFAVTLALDGERSGDALTVHANATRDCMIQATYLPMGGQAESVGITLTLGVWEEDIGGPSVILGELALQGAAGGVAPRSLEGTFRLVTRVEPCF